MADDVLLAKAAIIERCLKRIGEDYTGHEADFAKDFMRQDAVILKVHCERIPRSLLRGKRAK
jgi:hypothetical protein